MSPVSDNGLVNHARSMACDIKGALGDCFSGLGLVFYSGEMRLPVVNLADQGAFKPALPVVGWRNMQAVLIEICSVASPWHDGFHLISVDPTSLTHVSQFVAPPLDLIEAAIRNEMPSGARLAATKAVSKIHGVEFAMLLGKSGMPRAFSGGLEIGGLGCKTFL